MRDLPLDESPLAHLDAEHLRWRDAGALLWEASMLSAEGREEEARAQARRALAALPAHLRTAIFGRETAGTAAPPP